MKTRNVLVALIPMLLGLACGEALAETALPYVPGEVLIKFRSNATSTQRQGILNAMGPREVKPLGLIHASFVMRARNASKISSVSFS